MNLVNSVYPETDIKKLVSQSSPSINYKFNLYKAKENAGWVTLYFKYNEGEFEVLITLAAYDLTNLVAFFENITSSKEETALFLENEMISDPLLYVCPIDNKKIRFFVADGKRIHDLLQEDKISDEDIDLKGLFDYDIRCDIIIDKKTLLKQFYRVIKNIINTCTIYPEQIYDINYIGWKDNLKNIINYISNDD